MGEIMILERKMQMNVADMEMQLEEFKDILDTDIGENKKDEIIELTKLIQIYNSAMKEVSTKLEILDDEFHISFSHNPIHHLECRIKGIRSIFNKTKKYGIPMTLEAIKENVFDIAGIRVICNYIDDIYSMEKMLLKQTDISLIKRKDYIENPKENGYRSLHIVVSIPVFLSNRVENVPVEIQMRTVAMDYWASLEHKLKYKNNKNDMEQYSDILLECAKKLDETEKTMQHIKNSIS